MKIDHYITPIASLNIHSLQSWIGVPLNEIGEEMTRIRVALKKAVGYTWDNSHFVIMGSQKHNPVMEFLPSDNLISFWDARTGTTLFDFDQPMSKEDFLTLQTAAYKIEDGFTYCRDCGEWVNEYKHYDFAGAVCLKCYDSSKHLPPDTRGD